MTTTFTEMSSLPLPAIIAEFAPGPWIAIVIPLAGLAFAALSLVAGLIVADRNRRMRHETIRLALEKGQPIPAQILEEAKPPAYAPRRKPRNDRRSGLVLIGIAAGLYFAFAGLFGGGAKWLAAIPGFLGLALLLNWLIEGSQNPPAPPAA